MTSASMPASTQRAEFRAAGTDLSERRRSGVSQGRLIDIAAAPDTIGIGWGADGAARIGAFATISAIAADARINQAYPGLAAAALGLATPQIRHLATLGGNLAPASRRADRIVPPAAAIISIASPSISAPAWPRIPRQWQRRYWPMRRQSPPTEGAG